MEWELRYIVGDPEAVLDDSGVYVVVHRVETPETHKGYSGIRVSVRADLMLTNERNEVCDIKGEPQDSIAPIMSFQGTANAVRKALTRFLADHEGWPSMLTLEHASYIGYELLRAELTPGYVQD